MLPTLLATLLTIPSGEAIVKRAQCQRCHPITGHSAAPLPEPLITIAPDLGTLARRVRPQSIRRYLDAPHDLRPYLKDAMIPLRLTASEKHAVVRYLVHLAGEATAELPPDPVPSEAQAARGRKTFIAKHCADCHQVGNERLLPWATKDTWRAMNKVAPLAPNLRHTPGRIPRAILVRYIQDPKSVDPQSTMPPISVSAAQAESIADFLLHPLKLPVAQAPATNFPLTPKKITWRRIYSEVLQPACVSCHFDSASNAGEGGPGNTGGLSYPGVGLNLQTYEGVKRGLVREGVRLDILRGPKPLLYITLLKRHREAARDTRDPMNDADTSALPAADAAHPGMPLGRPPLSAAQMSLIKTWLSQGAPGSTL